VRDGQFIVIRIRGRWFSFVIHHPWVMASQKPAEDCGWQSLREHYKSSLFHTNNPYQSTLSQLNMVHNINLFQVLSLLGCTAV
jgi:hypothetical protein